MATVVVSCAVTFPDVVDDGAGANAGMGGDSDGGGPAGGGGFGGDADGGGGTTSNGGGGGMLDGGGGSGAGMSTMCTAAEEFEGEDVGNCFEPILNAGDATIDVSAGELLIQPLDDHAWWQAETSWFLYREITGSFAVVASVNAFDGEEPSNPPDVNGGGSFLMTGLLVRKPPGAMENWIKLEVGYRNTNAFGADPVGVLGGLTVDNTSGWLAPFNPDGDAELGHRGLVGVCRQADSIYLYTRLEGQTEWTRRVDDTSALDMFEPVGDPLQVGILSGSYQGTEVLTAGLVEYVRYAEGVNVQSPTNCVAVLEDLAAGPNPACDCE